MRLVPLALCAIAILMSVPARADERADIGLPPEGHTLVNLSASENKVLKQDLLVASLRMEVKGKDSKSVQNDINQAMAKALAEVKKYDTLKISTGSYSLYEYHEPIVDKASGEVTGHDKQWRGAQTITFESVDSESVLDAAGKLQDMGFAMNSLDYTLSPDVAEKERDALIVAAIEKLKAKAAVIAKALGKSGYELAEVNIDGNMGAPPMPYARAMKMEMAAADMAAPVAEAGESTVSLSVSARVLLKP